MYDELMEEQEVGVLPGILQRLLEREGMSGAELARRIGVHKSSISLILSGKHHSTSVATAAKMAQVFGVSMDYLVGLSTTEKANELTVEEISSPTQEAMLEMSKILHRFETRTRDAAVTDTMVAAMRVVERVRGEDAAEEFYLAVDHFRRTGDDALFIAWLSNHFAQDKFDHRDQ